MPYRTITAWTVLIGIVGLVLLLPMGLAGVEPERVAGRGPRWMRRLIVAAFVVLSALGVLLVADRGAGSRRGSLGISDWFRDLGYRLGLVRPQVSCYEPMPVTTAVTTAQNRLGRLSQQSDLLEDEMENPHAGPEVLRVRFQSVLDEAKALDATRPQLNANEQDELDTITARARAALERIEAAHLTASRPASRPAPVTSEGRP